MLCRAKDKRYNMEDEEGTACIPESHLVGRAGGKFFNLAVSVSLNIYVGTGEALQTGTCSARL